MAEQEEEGGHDEGRVDHGPLGQQALDQRRSPHQDAAEQGQPLVVGDHLELESPVRTPFLCKS